MNFADTLLNDIKLMKRAFQARDLTAKDVVIDELSFLYCCCVASERLLEEAAQELAVRWSGRFNEHLTDYYRAHLKEERGELPILVEDLASVGIDVDQGVVRRVAIDLIGSQYYMIKHAHPVCLLGYMAIVEADPIPIETVEALEAMHGKELFRFVRLHAIKDLDHAHDLIEVINAVPEELRYYVTYSTNHSLMLYQKR